METKFRPARVLVLCMAALMAACGGGGGDNTASSPGATGATRKVTIEFKAPRAIRKDVPVSDPRGNSLVITAVSMTLQDIDLERATQSVDCFETGNEDNEDCSDAIAGPVRFDMNLAPGSAGQRLEVNAPIGTFDRISFDISVPDGGDPEERAYLQANPELRDASLLVRGSFNGRPFTYTTDVRGDQEVAIVPPLVVTASGPATANVNVAFDVSRWFRAGDGTLIDPNTVNPASAETIRQNIRNSIESGSGSD